MKHTGVIANSIMLDNVIDMNAALNILASEGLIPSIDELAALSPYQTRHIKRFGNYELDLAQIAAPPTDDLTFEVEGASSEAEARSESSALAPPAAPPGDVNMKIIWDRPK